MKKQLVVLTSLALPPIVALICAVMGFWNNTQQLLLTMLFAWPISTLFLWVLLAFALRIPTARRAGAQTWSLPSKWFHWVMGGAILSSTALMYYMVNIGDTRANPELRAEYGRLLKIHKSLGLVVLFLVVFRFIWNVRRRRPPMSQLSSLQQKASHLTHYALYALMLFVPLIGWMASITYGGKTSFFGLFELPVWLPKNIEWAGVLQPTHIKLAWGMLGLVGVHLLAALWHHFVRRDATLVQMLPRGIARR